MKEKNSGITLVALVITIIIMLILAGVTLSIVAGSDGLINKAVKAVDKTNEAAAKEYAELLFAEISADYYDKRYVEKDSEATGLTLKAYLAKKMEAGKKVGNYFVTLVEDKITVYEGESSDGTLEIATGTLSDDVQVVWDEKDTTKTN